jgi:hypothetical protein
MSDTCHVGVCVESGGTCTAMAMDPFPSACQDAGSGTSDDDAGFADAGLADAATGDAATAADGGSIEDSGPPRGDPDEGGTSDAAVGDEATDSGCDCSTPVGKGSHPSTPLLIGLALCALRRRRSGSQIR